jgi:hypothetical protein
MVVQKLCSCINALGQVSDIEKVRTEEDDYQSIEGLLIEMVSDLVVYKLELTAFDKIISQLQMEILSSNCTGNQLVATRVWNFRGTAVYLMYIDTGDNVPCIISKLLTIGKK